MSLLTRCAHCHTVFRITPEQLQAHGGQVRCGRCMQVFNGMASLAPAGTPVEPQSEAKTAEATVAGEAAAETPQYGVAADPVTAPVSEAAEPEPEPESLADADSDAEVDGVAAEGMVPAETSGATETRPVMVEEPEPVADAGNPFMHPSPARQPAAPRSLIVAAALLAVALVAQTLYFYRGELAARHPLAREWLHAACASAGCTVDLPRVTKALLIEASDLQLLDPARPERIQLTATLRNHAGYDLAYPALDLVLTNASDHTLARRIFLPADYLGAGRDVNAGIAANAELTVRLALETGNLGAAGFRLALLPAPMR